MSNAKIRLAVAALVVVGGAATVSYKWWTAPAAVAQAPAGPRPIAVATARAVKKKIPVQIEALGNVAPIASVTVRTRVDSEVVGIHFADGATVKKGDLLVTLDSRAITAQIAQSEAMLARNAAQLEGAERDLRRYTELSAKNATTLVNLDNARTQVATLSAAVKADAAALENLKVQLSYYTIRASISGRAGVANSKVGNLVRAADALPITSIIQSAPIYVSLTIPQVHLPDIREALANETATVQVAKPGSDKRASGAVSMIENTVDTATGMITLRATMPNTDELLWPGTLVSVVLTVREDEAVAVPVTAVQVGQQGSYVFVVSDGVARVQPVRVARTLESETVLAEGLSGGETVVTDGHLQLTNNARVTVRERRGGP